MLASPHRAIHKIRVQILKILLVRRPVSDNSSSSERKEAYDSVRYLRACILLGQVRRILPKKFNS